MPKNVGHGPSVLKSINSNKALIIGDSFSMVAINSALIDLPTVNISVNWRGDDLYWKIMNNLIDSERLIFLSSISNQTVSSEFHKVSWFYPLSLDDFEGMHITESMKLVALNLYGVFYRLSYKYVFKQPKDNGNILSGLQVEEGYLGRKFNSVPLYSIRIFSNRFEPEKFKYDQKEISILQQFYINKTINKFPRLMLISTPKLDQPLDDYVHLPRNYKDLNVEILGVSIKDFCRDGVIRCEDLFYNSHLNKNGSSIFSIGLNNYLNEKRIHN